MQRWILPQKKQWLQRNTMNWDGMCLSFIVIHSLGLNETVCRLMAFCKLQLATLFSTLSNSYIVLCNMITLIKTVGVKQEMWLFGEKKWIKKIYLQSWKTNEGSVVVVTKCHHSDHFYDLHSLSPRMSVGHSWRYRLARLCNTMQYDLSP